jgi:hypothetical protein
MPTTVKQTACLFAVSSRKNMGENNSIHNTFKTFRDDTPVSRKTTQSNRTEYC